MFNKVLVANRGEIAVRIIRALKELSIPSVAVYSEVDRDSLHVKLADEAYCIGPANSNQSYLNIPAIMSVAEVTDADAIHPGYGFLAENAHFAEVCESSGVKFIGPSSEIIALMGDKVKARETMIKAGVPVVPGTEQSLTDIEKTLELAEEIGYPVIVKAAAGGGGKGMRIAQNAKDLKKAIQTAQREAEAAFGNAEVYMEKYVEEPRHIEFQILADEHGNVIHLGERDCSIQRRHQKIVEESPSPALEEGLRYEMGQKAVKVAKAVSYANAGTVEFLLDKDNNYYFIEMNTRVQVEHPVTEYVTGIDIIKEQIRIAAGEKLVFNQDDIKLKGVALECRINAEDPEKGFIPSPGRLEEYIIPGGPGVRIDSGVYPGYFIPPNYDSMVAKLIVWEEDREKALSRMERALDEFFIDGIKTTIPYHLRILNNAYFRKGNYHTNFIHRRLNNEK
ncbi:acetyl-CoA carboxylase biotin carboxylase subunit [Iocasia frigidifontis]|uniref:Biotin carboxylase n=1 Tax=Iocasia fonsfrigidae TaxID=2682810 RepID=A0A8A7KFP5_9FIRM|nr:acetyl-CoA carboxylase biotin carboxylase subunit [Iocasia fonsfrigidae]QTL98528.1 acetyl-CoA carboxylase biotin carboxylase subunit [Iocasia fonsfrigidae]